MGYNMTNDTMTAMIPLTITNKSVFISHENKKLPIISIEFYL